MVMSQEDHAAAIIVSAGKGVRMGTAEKKQFAMLGDRPVLLHTISAFAQCDVIEEIFLVTAKEDHDRCRREIILPLNISKPIFMICGGESRQESVFNGLKATEGRFEWVAIHDGVRPLIRREKIAECVEGAKKYGACILAVPSSDTVKTVNDAGFVTATLKRDRIRRVQTPQAFRYTEILDAHLHAKRTHYVGTDDAELIERRGGAVRIISGDPENIKITTPNDLVFAHRLLTTRDRR